MSAADLIAGEAPQTDFLGVFGRRALPFPVRATVPGRPLLAFHDGAHGLEDAGSQRHYATALSIARGRPRRRRVRLPTHIRAWFEMEVPKESVADENGGLRCTRVCCVFLSITFGFLRVRVLSHSTGERREESNS